MAATALTSLLTVGCALENPALQILPDAYPVDSASDADIDAPDTDIDAPDTDIDAPDTGVDAPDTGLDAPDTGVDVPDAATDLGPRPCASDADCRGSAAGEVCDTVTGRCVACRTDEHCPAGRSCCGAVCVDPRADVAHCGGCDRRCSLPLATSACRDGACAVESCVAPNADCNMVASDGCETDTATSASHCGACGHACPTVGTTSACVAGACTISACATGFGDCDGSAANGCEVDTRVTAAHCGACGRPCPTPPNTVATCAAGACASACAANFGDCDGNTANGCETDLRASPANCGACGRTGTEVCDTRDNDCDGLVDEGFSAVGCVSLACSGSGVIHTISNTCLDDFGLSAGSDELKVYCVGGVARFCLTGESCPWRSGVTTTAAVTCSRAGLATDVMGRASCERWNNRSTYACDAMGRVYFP